MTFLFMLGMAQTEADQYLEKVNQVLRSCWEVQKDLSPSETNRDYWCTHD